MEKLYRVLGKRGRVTIPYELRVQVGFAYNDILSFEVSEDGAAITVRRERICSDCERGIPEKNDELTLYDILEELTGEERKAALLFLTVQWAEKQEGEKQCEKKTL